MISLFCSWESLIVLLFKVVLLLDGLSVVISLLILFWESLFTLLLDIDDLYVSIFDQVNFWLYVSINNFFFGLHHQ